MITRKEFTAITLSVLLLAAVFYLALQGGLVLTKDSFWGPPLTGTPKALKLLSPTPYQNSLHGYNIRPPQRWTITVIAEGAPGELVRFQQEPGKATTTSTIINIYPSGVISDNLESSVQAAKAFDEAILIPIGYTVGELKKVFIGREKGYLLEEINTEEGGVKKNRYFVARNGKLLVIEVYTPKEKWDSVKDLFEASVSTFK